MAKIAVIGTGIAGLGAAYLLDRRHEITVFEKAGRLGGHARTLTVDYDGKKVPVDTGFIVFNEPNYPQLSAMFAHLGVATHKSDMTFAASIRDGWLEWGAKDLNAVFGQRRNLLRPRFALLARDVLRFNARAQATVEDRPDLTLDGMIAALKLGDWFRRFYLLPMCSAIWSCPPAEMMNFPARTLIRFMANHRLLSASGQPQWYTVTGGAQEYVSRLSASFADRVRLNCGAARVIRNAHGAVVTGTDGSQTAFDQVVFACHGDEALALLADADARERSALSAFRYQRNVAVLHRDSSVMPRAKNCWASWIYSSDGDMMEPKLSVTYWMNLLQGIPGDTPLFVTLNPKRPIAADKIFDSHEFFHPVFDHDALAAQDRVQAMQGSRNTWFCGAHLRHGFHEDGLASAVHVARLLGANTPWQAPRPAFREPETRLAVEYEAA
jgi:predicted NAD/FAD-binding protein